MIPALAPVGRTTTPLNREYWHATEQYELAYRNQDAKALKYWSGELARMEADDA